MMSSATGIPFISSSGGAATAVSHLSRPTKQCVDIKLSYSSFGVSLSAISYCPIRRRGRRVSCEVGLKSNSGIYASASAAVGTETTSSSLFEEENDTDASAKIGAKVRVKVPLKVYHIPKVPELDLTGMEGELKQYVGLWKGKRISANLPYKVEFVTHVEGRGPVKFSAHLKEDEFDYI